jgi:hypothetical protein
VFRDIRTQLCCPSLISLFREQTCCDRSRRGGAVQESVTSSRAPSRDSRTTGARVSKLRLEYPRFRARGTTAFARCFPLPWRSREQMASATSASSIAAALVWHCGRPGRTVRSTAVRFQRSSWLHSGGHMTFRALCGTTTCSPYHLSARRFLFLLGCAPP